MTEQKAIEHLRIQKPTGNQRYKEPTKKAFDMAIQALEKQIPKEPIDRIMYIECPKCGSVDLGRYCMDCGQAIKWG